MNEAEEKVEHITATREKNLPGNSEPGRKRKMPGIGHTGFPGK
jgi:hypothetical protein